MSKTGKKNFLLVEHGGPSKEFTLEALKEKGLNVYLATTKTPPWALKYTPKENIINTDTYNSVKLLTDVTSFFESMGEELHATGTFYEHTVPQTADLASALNLIGLNPGAARRSSNNKLLMRKFCRNSNLPSPSFKVVRNISKKLILEAIKQVGLPCVIKPVFGAESYGTIKIEEGSNLNAVIKEVKSHISTNKKEVFKNFSNVFLIEEYVPGLVVSVDGLIQNNNIHIAGMVEFMMGPEPRFTQEANYIPPRIDKLQAEKCKQLTVQIIKALGFDNCGFHCEQRITPKGPMLIEIAARLPGGPLQPGYKKAYGINLTSLLIDIWLGKKINVEKKNRNYILQKAVFPTIQGKIGKIEGLNRAIKNPKVWDFVKISNVGDNTTIYPDIPIPYYYYAISEKTRKKLQALQNHIESSIKFEVI